MQLAPPYSRIGNDSHALMNRSWSLPVLPVLGLTLLLTGCFHSREIQQIRNAVEAETPGTDYDQRIVVSLGPVSLQLARWITTLVDDPDAQEAGAYLGDVRRVKVGVFEASGFDAVKGSRLPSGLRHQLERTGWELALQVRDEEELVWVFFRERRGVVRDIFLTVADGEELVIVRFKGRLDRILARALDRFGPDPMDYETQPGSDVSPDSTRSR
jgi:hypothetical protein